MTMAQSWCPPGAQWNYEDMSIGFYGHYHRAYIGDTVFLGHPAQRIRTTGMRASILDQDTVWIDEVLYTTVQDDILMVPAWSPNGTAWDTLLRFDAVPGDRWFFPNHGLYCAGAIGNTGIIQVNDTGTVLVDGVPIRRWQYMVDLGNGVPVFGGEWYYERIGFIYGMVPYPFCGWTIDAGENFRCYWDGEITFTNPQLPGGTTWCDVALSTSGAQLDHGIGIFPNPGSEQLTVALPERAHAFTMLDPVGRMIAAGSGLSGSTTLSTAHLAPGQYLIRIESADGMRITLRWVKE